jgi:UPF0755 protein
MTRKRIIFYALLIIGAIGFYFFIQFNKIIYFPIVKHDQFIYIPTGSKMQDIENILMNSGIIIDKSIFEKFAKWKRYDKHLHSGKFKLKKGMSMNKVINTLRKGDQEPVRFVLHNIRTKKELIKDVCSFMEADSSELKKLLNDNEFLMKYKVTRDNVLVMFIPDYYQFFWNTSAKQFFDRMSKIYNNFWNNARLEKAIKMNMSIAQISILASIVQLETTKADEMPVIAGVYINRLMKGIPLQADPTVIYSSGDFNIHRLLNGKLKIDSPYNTYKYKGLPPGPICLPNALTIDKVLNYDHNNYLFFCAKEDMSGYHNFSRTTEEHAVNAMNYRNALNKLSINN